MGSQIIETKPSLPSPSAATRTISDYLLTHIMESLDQDKFKEMTHKLPHEGQVYVQSNIGIMKEKFAEFIGRYANTENSTRMITEDDVKSFFKELNTERIETLKYHMGNQ